jgi:hypothetical protein
MNRRDTIRGARGRIETGLRALMPPAIFGASLKGWWRSDLGITLNGSNVSAWADQSGNGQNVAQVTATKQPPYHAGGAGAAYLDMSGASGGATVAQLLGGTLNLTHPFEVWTVASAKSAASRGYIIDFGASTGNNCSTIQSNNISGGAQTVIQYNTGYGTGVAIPTLNTPFATESLFNGASSSLAVNNVPTSTNIAATDPPANSNISIGNYFGGNFAFDGLIYEVFVTAGAATAAQRAAVASYFTGLYGVA